MFTVMRAVVLRSLSVMCAALGVLAIAPALAAGSIGGSGGFSFAGPVTVGQRGVPAAIVFTNKNSDEDANVMNTVCTADGSLECGSRGILVTPSCAQTVGGRCTTAGAERDVLRLSPTGTGRSGTDCAGIAFTTSVVDPTTGELLVSPQFAATRVRLFRSESKCIIDLTLDVLKLPAIDSDPQQPGAQTMPLLSSTHAAATGQTFSFFTPSEATVARATPTLATTPSGSTAPGGQLVDSATVNGRALPQPGATVTFKLYAPDEGTCSGPAVFTSVIDYPVGGGPVSSAAYTPVQQGVYHWVVAYSGDENNVPVSAGCKAANVAAAAGSAAAGSPTGSKSPVITAPRPGDDNEEAPRASTLTVRFKSGKPRARRLRFSDAPTITGTLKDRSGHGIANARIGVRVRRRQSGAALLPAATLRTSADGSFDYRLPAGPSRTVTFAYEAADPAVSASVSTSVRAALAARVTPRSPRVRRWMRLTGQLRHLPRAGVQILIQARDGRVWRPIGATKTRANGRFVWRYRFKRAAAHRTFALRAQVDSPIYPFTAGHSAAILVRVQP